MRHAITHACLCTRLKYWTCKKSSSCLTQKASRCVTDCTSKTMFFIFSLSINVLTIIFEIKKKENNAAVLTRCWFKNPSLLVTPLHCIIWNFEKKIVLFLKDFFSQSFHSCKFFHELCKKWKLKGNLIEWIMVLPNMV